MATAEAPDLKAVGERPERTGDQLEFAGMPQGEATVNLIGPVTLPPDVMAKLALGQSINLKVTADVRSVSGRSKRNQWGDDEAEVRWQLYVTEAVVK